MNFDASHQPTADLPQSHEGLVLVRRQLGHVSLAVTELYIHRPDGPPVEDIPGTVRPTASNPAEPPEKGDEAW
ncbi:hypothetical protein ACFWOG_03590 [Kitasatospora sp. NPDC058406]|uniref:hypothetical protein n=1 Tax=Kitasatospora sp. NPDC058406 TaxID=3346483 RepID=UPI00364838CF